MSLKVGIVGAAGYAGAELIRLVLGHPEFELVGRQNEAGNACGRSAGTCAMAAVCGTARKTASQLLSSGASCVVKSRSLTPAKLG